MAEFNFDNLKKELLAFVGDNLKKAKTEIEEYIDSKKDDIESWPEAIKNGTLTKPLLETLLLSPKKVIESILLRYTLKLKLDSEEKAIQLAVDLAEKLIKIILKALI